MIYTFKFAQVLPHWPDLLWGAWLTLRLSVSAMVLGLVGGIVFALAERSSFRVLRLCTLSFGEVIRNTPFLVQVFLVFFGLPSIGIRLSPNEAALLALSVNTAAYCSEIIRAGLENVPRGEIEAGRALGLSNVKILALIMFPQALQAVYPSITSQFMMLLMSSSVVSVVSAEELTSIADNLSSTTFLSLEVYVVTTAVYLGLSMVVLFVLKAIGRYFFAGSWRAAGGA